MEEKIDKKNVELCVIPTSTKKFTERNEDYIDEILKKLPWKIYYLYKNYKFTILTN